MAAVTGVLLATGACTSPGGVAGISTTAPTTEAVSAQGPVTATIPAPTPTPQPTVEIPKGDAPVPVPPPRVSKFTYAFPVQGCPVSYQSRLLVLPKTTIWTGKGCSFVSPVDGVVHEVNTRNRWKPSTDRGPDREGRFVTVIGDDGVRYLGGHLDSVTPGIRPGVRVGAGQTLGRVGNSGNARDTASNLYFAISWKTEPSLWWVRRGMVGPWDYLNAWLNGNRTLSPADEVRAAMARTGAAPRCTILCKPKSTPKPEPTKRPDESEGWTVEITPAG
ncbi:M23 family metallopeptidase [Planomonospora sp. ID67723]|uniref:M23 family metallopeptidase n=1 Tax=Planomonospora sp. ID67723 TaxID=2738134 RepID=UPI001E425BA2|nr:M23 family metallopeptidase [Planomonospora sp. ID67723]